MMLFINSYLCKTEEVMDNKSIAKALLLFSGLVSVPLTLYWLVSLTRRERENLKCACQCAHMLMQTMTVPVRHVLRAHRAFPCSPLSIQYLPGNVCPLVHVFVCMFALRKTED